MTEASEQQSPVITLNNFEAEEAVLGSILIDPEAVFDVSGSVTSTTGDSSITVTLSSIIVSFKTISIVVVFPLDMIIPVFLTVWRPGNEKVAV